MVQAGPQSLYIGRAGKRQEVRMGGCVSVKVENRDIVQVLPEESDDEDDLKSAFKDEKKRKRCCGCCCLAGRFFKMCLTKACL